VIDSHQHFWDPARFDYPWMTGEVEPLRRAFGPADLAPLLAERGVSETVVVQATSSVKETAYLLDIAASTSFVAGVVAPVASPWRGRSSGFLGEELPLLDRSARPQAIEIVALLLSRTESPISPVLISFAPALAHQPRPRPTQAHPDVEDQRSFLDCETGREMVEKKGIARTPTGGGNGITRLEPLDRVDDPTRAVAELGLEACTSHRSIVREAPAAG
jgi:hypothetical protein